MRVRNGRARVVLLGEDDPGHQELMRLALCEGPVRTDLHVVQHGEEAMEYLLRQGRYAEPSRSPRPDLVLLDLNMPRLDGRQVLQRMRAHPDLRRIPVVVLTMAASREDVVQCYDLGCNAFITKPADLDQFNDAMRQLESYWFELITLPA